MGGWRVNSAAAAKTTVVFGMALPPTI